MLTALRRTVGKMIHKTYYWPYYYKKYNNVLGPKVNGIYRRFGDACRANYAQVTGTRLRPEDSTIFQRGSVLIKGVVPTAKAEELSRDITRRIDQDDQVTKGPFAHQQIKVNRPISTLGDVVLECLRNSEADKELRNFFGGYYRLVYAESYRSLPTNKPEASWLWHSDSYPVDTCKVMLFLTDAGKDQGATQFMSRDDTMRYRGAGYFGTVMKDRLADLEPYAKEHGLPYRPFVHEAKAGDVMLFENNGLHRAVPPKSGFRDVVVFALLPSMKPWDEQLKLDGLDQIEASTHFPKDPAHGAAMGKGGMGSM